MASISRPSTSYTTATTSYQNRSSVFTSLQHGRRSAAPTRPGTGRGSRASSIMGGRESQQIICAVSESRGISPTVGLAFINISTGEAVLSQICDNQFYVRTLNKLEVFEPTEILLVSGSNQPNAKSKMCQVIESNIIGSKLVFADRKYWSESAGLEYIQQLGFLEDIEAIKVAVEGNYFATCCFAAVLRYLDLKMLLTFAFHSLRIKYQPSEGTMMIDLSTIRSLELIKNLRDPKSTDCLFGLMNETLTPMGSRLLRSCILQPSTQEDVLGQRYEALEEISSNEEMFLQIRQALRSFTDIEKLLTDIIVIPTNPDMRFAEQSINQILKLKSYIHSISPVYDALAGVRSGLLIAVRENCRPQYIAAAIELINEVINEDVTSQQTPLGLRNQRTYAVKSGVNGLLDVARQTFKEATEDVHQHITDINEEYSMHAETKFDNSRRYYLRVAESDFPDRQLPDILINRFRRRGYIECQTLDMVKLNQRIEDSHQEVVLMSDKTIQELLDNIRAEIPRLFKICESIAMLDMIAGFVQMVTAYDYVRPEITDCVAIKAGRHPIREKIHHEKFIPNDVYATHQSRFQIVTGCNMSGKSTYIRSIALMTIMAQVGCFVPAQYASFRIIYQLFARVSMDDNIEANVSTFASEMRETAFILRNIDDKSLAIIDELGRGTSTRDGLAIALSIAEALVESKALVWFATHFRELAQILGERPGVVNLHLTVDMSDQSKISMLYKIEKGFIQENHYGLALAKVVELPQNVLEVAEKVTSTLEAQLLAKKQSSKAVALAKRRKLVLSLKESLKQAHESPMQGMALVNWLRRLQTEFVTRMEQIENESSGFHHHDEAGDGASPETTVDENSRGSSEP
ncbi:DNA mismatch repair protein-like protein MutS [Xylogone sp. PMI_703]|nr:DNA mismatch repair protein-like protein MutS [Xylogone sp. PMI_703]